jgi:hypothetical protein
VWSDTHVQLGVALLLNPPWYFSLLWAILWPFMNSVTRSKFRIVKVANRHAHTHAHTHTITHNHMHTHTHTLTHTIMHTHTHTHTHTITPSHVHTHTHHHTRHHMHTHTHTHTPLHAKVYAYGPYLSSTLPFSIVRSEKLNAESRVPKTTFARSFSSLSMRRTFWSSMAGEPNRLALSGAPTESARSLQVGVDQHSAAAIACALRLLRQPPACARHRSCLVYAPERGMRFQVVRLDCAAMRARPCPEATACVLSGP